MLQLKPFRQTSGFCGPASLKIVLSYYGVEKSEKELVKLTGCTKTGGTTADAILAAAKKLGFTGFCKDFSTIAALRQLLKKGVPVIVDWFSADEGHYSVAVGVDAKSVYLQDPELGGIRKMDVEDFKRVWFDFPGKYIKSKQDVIVRRMIVIRKA